MISLKHLSFDPSAVREVPAKVAVHYRCLPIGWEDGVLKLAVSSELDAETLDEIREKQGG